ncbi:NFACT family protein [Trichocoleus sp. FACHB-591]|uniref:Rqc2 family fibronectin-binding protein n=1 Tax=Trichocoleus sp. FACHB-591 TaxID=2692872 RepID=UPI001684C576|nr:NFACT family protein [Trichocoleus sp. FACHB-591]MBD2098931.1 NFACT family protein [Trichocoleus sp. FACHB-591]
MQPVDFTTLTAACCELRADWLPSRLEQVYQRDRFTLAIALRTLKHRSWLTISWHPQAARLCIGDPPPRTPDTFTFSQQLQHQLGGLALVAIEAIAPWERALDLQFARRPGDPPLWHLYVEIMGKYSNVILANQENLIVTAAHQVSAQQSSVRPILTGQPYELPPALTDPAPSLSESYERWRERISLVPGALRRTLIKNYRGLSSALVLSMLQAIELDPEQSTEELSESEWQRLFATWQTWLRSLESCELNPGWTQQGYTVLGWGKTQAVESVQILLNQYYTAQLNRQEFVQLHHQLTQKVNNVLAKVRLKADLFRQRLAQSDQADQYREQADLLMAHLQEWQPGMKVMTLADFHTEQPVAIALDPEKNAVQNAQSLYKKHQKLKRARLAVEPLLAEVQVEVDYLEQVEAALVQMASYQAPADLIALEEIRDELIQQQYLESLEYRSRPESKASTEFYRFQTPSGFELLIGRNNRQNDQLTFRLAGDYDLWFHTQEIPGSHVLLRLDPGKVPEKSDLEFTADLAAYYSRARQSEQVPVVYTEPKHVYKPKGAKPGMAIYKQEQVIWGQPQRACLYLSASNELSRQ